MSRSGGNSLRRSGWHSCTTRSGRETSRSWWLPRSVSQASAGSRSSDQILGRARQHGLAAVGEIAQPCGPVDRRADVVAFVAQLHLAGVHADAQPDRRERRPLQVQRARHRVAGAGERDHEAVALALLDRPHPAVGGDACRTRVRSRRATAAVISSGWVSHSRVEPSTSASSSVTVPVGSSLTPNSLQFTGGVSARGSISLMLASMGSPHTAKASSRCAYLRPSRTRDLRLLADGLRPATSDSRLVTTRGGHDGSPH